KIKTDDKKKQILFSLERQVSLSGKESPARTALQAVSQSAANVAVEKSHVRKAVIVDLRDRIEQHGESSKKQANAQVKKTHLEAGVSVAKKASSVKDPFEVTYLSRTAPQVDSPADGRGLRFQEPPAPRNALATRFGEIMKNEMVKHTGVIVKNGGNGEIHLVLKPESLGSVRIRMNIEDNHIVGKIIVDNNTVKAIVEENLSNLENALQEDGYENPAFDVFVAGDQNRGAEEKATFASLLDEEPRPELGGTASYDEERASYYDESLVNIVW
ncbi:MAG TPA: flagellar hook-length control protein FliK, partial [Spirochaetia bacterium]|nr:flagellar hook-length control protein FliK [Spirochaetia bacterium]